VLGNDRKREATMAGLTSAHGVLQSRIGQQLSLRRTPRLTFAYDESVERGVRMTKLIDDLAADLPAEPPPTDDAPISDDERNREHE
jgi:ribosome-binding factor A